MGWLRYPTGAGYGLVEDVEDVEDARRGMETVTVELPRGVYDELKRRARVLGYGSSVDVIRRFLWGDGLRPPSSKIGALEPLLRANLVAPGDELVFRRPRLGERYVAYVTDGGCIEFAEGTVHTTPSNAAKECTSQAQNGWNSWRHSASGKRLDELRSAVSLDSWSRNGGAVIGCIPGKLR
jgi:hypothetical protein